MTELEWCDDYSGQTIDELIALEGKYRTDSIVVAIDQALQEKEQRVGQRGLTKAERVVLATEALERSVNGEGYDGFFRDECGFAPFALEALNAIGCSEVAEITQEAINALGIEGPLTPEKLESAMEEDNEQRDDGLEECDERYFETAGDLSEPLLEFIKANRDQIHLKA